MIYYVPIERRRAPADDLARWTILVFDTLDASDAQMCAVAFLDTLPTKGWVVWAAVRDCPSFPYMQSLREAMDASRKRHKLHQTIPGYV